MTQSKERPTPKRGSSYFRPGETVFLNCCEESSHPHPHSHDFIEIAYVASGRGYHYIRGERYPVSKGDLFVINFDIIHEFRSLEGENEPPLQVYNCVFLPEFLDYSLLNCKDFSDIAKHFLFRSLFPEEIGGSSDIHMKEEDSRAVEELYQKMLREFRLRPKGYIEMLRAYVIELLVTVFRLYASNDKFHQDTLVSNQQEIVTSAMKYLEKNYQKGVSLEELSGLFFLSPNYFCKLFKETTQCTVSDYIQTLRIDRACQLLASTGRTILSISYEVGYKDIKFFNKVFKKKTGLTPGGYRKEAQRESLPPGTDGT